MRERELAASLYHHGQWAKDGGNRHLADAPAEVQLRYLAYAWCLKEMRSRAWFYADEPIPAFVPNFI